MGPYFYNLSFMKNCFFFSLKKHSISKFLLHHSLHRSTFPGLELVCFINIGFFSSQMKKFYKSFTIVIYDCKVHFSLQHTLWSLFILIAKAKLVKIVVLKYRLLSLQS
jgi:hypothetical protein